MNYLDLIVGAAMLVFAWKGWHKGIILEVMALAAFATGIYGAMHFSDFTAERLVEFVEKEERYLGTVAFVLTFILLVVAVNVLGRLLRRTANSLNMGLFDRLGGLLFGAAKGVLLCSTVLLVMNNLELWGFVRPEVKAGSKLLPYVERVVPYVYAGFDLVRDGLHDVCGQMEQK